MIRFHAVMLDETRCEFGVRVKADSRESAYEKLKEDYPESRCVQLESPADTEARESAMREHLSRGGDYDDEGRPIPGAYYEYEYDDDDDDDDDDSE